MPHLSPMNWLLAITSIWLLIMTISSLMWWKNSIKWPCPGRSLSTSIWSSWTWHNL